MMFKDLIKIAAPKWTKMIANDLLSSEAISKIVSKNTKTRDIKPLGVGGLQVVDLVAHPTHGLSVRKLPITNSTKDIPWAKSYSARQEKDWKVVNEINSPNVTRMLGKEGPATFFEYSKPSVLEPSTRLNNLRSRAIESNATPGKIHKLNLMNFYEIGEMNVKNTDKFLPAIAKIKEKFPSSWDFSLKNVVGDKIVDFEQRRHGNSRIWGNMPQVSEASYTNTKKILFGKTK